MRILIFFSFLIYLSSILGCKKDGPVGPEGLMGATGQAGSSTIIAVDTFSVPISSWVSTSPDFYKFVHTSSLISQHVVDGGSISVFVKNSTYPDWYAMPYTVAGGGGGQRFYYNLNTLTLLSENYSSGINYVYQFKVVIYN